MVDDFTHFFMSHNFLLLFCILADLHSQSGTGTLHGTETTQANPYIIPFEDKRDGYL